MHQVVGGNAFNTSIATTDVSALATCTTCNFADDFSNYWTANLYFKARNGTYKRVPQVPNRLLFGDKFTTQTSGGFVVYYVSPGKGKVTAFKPVSAHIYDIFDKTVAEVNDLGIPHAHG